MTPNVMIAVRSAGITLSADDGGNLIARPKAALTDELRSLIREHKVELLTELAMLAQIEAKKALIEYERITGIAPSPMMRAFARVGVKTGDTSVETVQSFEEAAIAREAADLKEFFEERAAILEHDAGLPRGEAQLEAARMTAALARNRGYLWASLRAALAGYPDLLALVPDSSATVDALGVAHLAVLKDKRVVRQGAFTGPPEVKP